MRAITCYVQASLPVKQHVQLCLVLVSLVIFSAVATSDQFCSHSIGRQYDATNSRRVRRASTTLRHHRNSGRSSSSTEEDQVLIDEATDSIQANKYVKDAEEKVTQARIDCSRSTSSSNGFIADPVPGRGELKDDCNVKTIETAVFIDQALDNKYSGLSGGLAELNKLVLTIMNQVQHIFRYSSIKIPIRIKLVLVEHLKDLDRRNGPAPNPERGDIDAYLGNFCNWQHSRLEREKRMWWDHAILLSGLDLYKTTPSKNHTGVLGLAWVGGMCKGNYSCTINEASNLESAFVIAHEIGHSLGITHDGQRNTCDPNGYIMSERTGAGKIHWSKCSNSYLNTSIANRQLTCLDVEQNQAGESLYDLSKLRAPGQVYTINDQCKLAFGSNYTSFVTRQSPFNAVCRELWCVAGTWAKAAHPALEGSACGDQNRVCREGKCVNQ